MNQTNNSIANKIKDLIHKKELYIKDISIFTNEMYNLSKIIEDYNNDIENIKFNEEIENKIQRKEDDMKVLQNSKYELYDKYMELRDKILNIETFINEKNTEISKNNALISELENVNKTLSNNIKEIETYNKNIENNKNINAELNKTKDSLSKSTTEIKRSEKEKDLLIEQICYTKKEIESYENYTNEIKTLELETKAYLNYIKIINKDGLPYMLLNNLIPLLQEGANNLLLPLTNFSISIEQDDDNSINVYKINNDNKLNVELCSGFEKFVIGLSIRISLINLSKLSSCNFMLIDEGFSCMDSNNINNLTSLFNTLKDMFDFVIIISHLDSVKSQCDNSITIEINGGFSSIVHE
jgi:DNA repair exonuclease SbcCD ATPase subunit